jgi:hypothetical protein
MLEIDVYFGLETGNPDDVLVRPDPAASHSGDDVIWHFHSVDKKVEYVELEFKDAGQRFFDSRTGKTHIRHAKVDHGGGAGKGAHGHILGVSPSNGGGTQKNAYWIRAYDKSPATPGATMLYKLDPTVVTCDP